MTTLMSQVQSTSRKGSRRAFTLPGLLLLSSSGLFLLTGCGGMVDNALTPAQPGVSIQGNIHGGQQPVAGATLQLYAAQATGYGAASVAFGTPVVSDNGGNFNLT